MSDNITLDQIETNESYDFFHLFNKDDDITDTTDLLINTRPTEYFSTETFVETVGCKSTPSSLGVINLNCQSLGAHWDSLKQFLCHIECKSFKFDIVGLTETFRIPKNLTYTINSYHPLHFNIKPEHDDGRGE